MAEKKHFNAVYFCCYYYSEHRKESVCATTVGNLALKWPQRSSGLDEYSKAGCEALSLETPTALSCKAWVLILWESWGRVYSCTRASISKVALLPALLSPLSRVPLQWGGPRYADLPPGPGQWLDPVAPSPKILVFPPVITGATAGAISCALLLSKATRGRTR